MPIDPLTIAYLIKAGLDFTGGLLEGDPQEAESFAGTGVDPTRLMEQFKPLLEGAFRRASERADRPIELPSAFVQDLPTFTGGGLPFPIGVSGSDPALSNRELLRIDSRGQIGGFEGPTAADLSSGITDVKGRVARRRQPRDLLADSGDDSLSQGEAAAQLMLEAIGGPQFPKGSILT